MKLIFEEYRDIIPDFHQFQEALREPFDPHLRINRIKIDPAHLLQRLNEKNIHLERANKTVDTLYLAPGLVSTGNLVEYFAGYIHPQAYTSCLASAALCPSVGSYVLDMCASPGGKTSHLAELMGNSGLVVANELFPSRHPGLGHTLSRLGVTNALVTGYQAQQFPLKQRFDFVLADVPCSGEGRFRAIEKSFVHSERRTKEKLPDLQKKIITRGFDLLKEDGLMVYSTCTYNPDENESVVNYLLNNRDAMLLPIEVGATYEPGLSQWRQKKYEEQLKRTARFYPHRINSVGFFMASIGRRR